MLDIVRRKAFVNFYLKHTMYRSILKNNRVPLAQRHVASFQQSTLPRNSSITKVVNRCTVSGRQYSIIQKPQLSRFVFRFESYKGHLPGVRRHS